MKKEGIPPLSTTPLLIPAVSVVLGILTAPEVNVGWPLLVVFGISVVLTWILYRRSIAQSIGLFLCFFLLGMLAGQRGTHSGKQGISDDSVVEAVVFSEPAEKPKTMAVDLLVTASHTGLTKHTESRLLRCYLWKDNRSRTLRLGQGVVVRNASKGFVRSSDWYVGGQAQRQMSRMQRVRLRFLMLREQLLGRYRTPMGKPLDTDGTTGKPSDIDGTTGKPSDTDGTTGKPLDTDMTQDEAYAVLAAMTLGDKSALTKELRETYSVTGASHILALSGLHLGIIYLLLSRLTLRRRRFWLSQAVVILSIWAFVFLTGLSTSIIRSATMISIYALFSVAGRHRSPVNLLCFTAIIMLLVSPDALYDIGFQLSFSAVLAILLLMPLFERLFPDNYFVSHPWKRMIYNLVGVSVAAQIGVAPLIAYHFGRFSTYFLLTNFIVIPAATFILYGALLVLLFPSLAGVLLEVVRVLNKALGMVSQMPCASIDGLHPSVLQVLCLYVFFLCLYLAARKILNY